MEVALTPEALFWFKVAGWLAIGGGATWVLGHIWFGDSEKKKAWEETLRKEERQNLKR